MSKINLCLVFGGQSGEHEISIMTAKSVFGAIDKEKYNLSFIGISTEGRWCKFDSFDELKEVTKLENPCESNAKIDGRIIDFIQKEVDVVFPLLHGPFGEDGTIQGLFEMMGKPYVGCGVMSSSLCMDKVQAKKVFEYAGIKTTPFIEVHKYSYDNDSVDKLVREKLEYPVFIKPANMGSSIGITKANNYSDLEKGLEEGFKFDCKLLIEKAINCREVECGVLGNYDPRVSTIGEILPSNEFYDYKAKYFDGGKSGLVIPAQITEEQVSLIKESAIKAFMAAGCTGISRIDFFIDKDNGDILLNEINTMPGFTEFSMYPQLWKNSGIPYSQLIDELIQFGIGKFNGVK